MSLTIQVFLIIVTISIFIFLIRDVKKGKLRTEYALMWILFSLGLVIISIFPQLVFYVSRILGIASPSNAAFLVVIMFLIILVYNLFSKVSTLEERVKNLVHEVAIQKKEIDDQKNNPNK